MIGEDVIGVEVGGNINYIMDEGVGIEVEINLVDEGMMGVRERSEIIVGVMDEEM
ncbi:hypothetical protein KI387_004527, partial [Taxus chinensis]